MVAVMRMSAQDMGEVWAELALAHCGQNGFGGDVAELYAYRFGQRVGQRLKFDDLIAAAEAMHDVLASFSEAFRCTVYVEGRPLGPWLRKLPFEHRVCVQVVPKVVNDGPARRSPVPKEPNPSVADIG